MNHTDCYCNKVGKTLLYVILLYGTFFGKQLTYKLKWIKYCTMFILYQTVVAVILPKPLFTPTLALDISTYLPLEYTFLLPYSSLGA